MVGASRERVNKAIASFVKLGWLEQDDVVNLHKIWCVLARRKVAQIGEARDDREVLIEVARRLGLDPAMMSNPFVAGIIDILGILIYVNVALKILG